MSIKSYGVLSGTVAATLNSIQAGKIDPEEKPHYHVEVSAGGVSYRAAVNVLSDDNPPDLQFYLDDNYQNSILDTIKGFAPGFQTLASKPGTGALDYVKENLVDISQMTIVPPMSGPNGHDLDDIMDQHFKQAMSTEGAVVYFFGTGFSDTTADEFFGFSPDAGIHNIHMNQGSTGHFADENGSYQDGAIFIYYPAGNTWTAMFTKFQSQKVE